MNAEAILAPFGILEVDCGQLFVVFGTSRETSDFIVDCLQLWWDERKSIYRHILRLQIDLDNGPEQASNRTQFIKRLVEFADKNGLVIEWVYYPPYHSKYNSIELRQSKRWLVVSSFAGNVSTESPCALCF